MSSLRRLRFPICVIVWTHSSDDHENWVERSLRSNQSTAPDPLLIFVGIRGTIIGNSLAE